MLTHKIEITDLVFGGDGIGKLNGKVCFVPLSAPGDLVEVIITEEKKDYSRGQIQNILQASADRSVPPCQYFEKCGGCNWQHLSYPSQVKYKQQLVESHFRRSFGEAWKLRDFQMSPLQFEYRNKI
ncbi:MAG: TRAM domain-containing protein, partial [Pseudobdellovibrionaceae bacterium]